MHIRRTSSDYIHDYKMDRGDLTADDGAQASQSRMQTVPGMPLGNSGGIVTLPLMQGIPH